jgi:uncharacterized membrane protein HdeD (DUF308 family)
LSRLTRQIKALLLNKSGLERIDERGMQVRARGDRPFERAAPRLIRQAERTAERMGCAQGGTSLAWEDRVVTSRFVRHWRSLGLRGGAALAFGLTALFWPGMTVATLALLIGLYALVDGVLAIAMGAGLHASRHVGWVLVLQGATGIALGLAVLVWSRMSVVWFTRLVGFWALASGLLELLTALHLRRELPRESMLGVAGATSIALGVAMLARPTAAPTVLVIVFGSFTLVFGTAMLAQAARLRRHHHPWVGGPHMSRSASH